MSVRHILVAPDSELKRQAEPIASVDESVRQLMDDMLETMYSANGIGLAAPQIGILQRVIVVDVSPDKVRDQALKMANPEIVWTSGDSVSGEEGCLSLPEHYADVARPSQIRVTYRDENGAEKTLEADGLLARCILHECDHLNGVLFVDHISTLKRNVILRKLTKAKRHGDYAIAS